MAIDHAIRQYRSGLLVSDAVAISAALLLAFVVRHQFIAIPTAWITAVPYTVLIEILALRRFGAYHGGRLTQGGLAEARQVGFGLVAGTTAVLALSFFYRGFSYSRLTVTIFVPLAFVTTLVFRVLYRIAVDRLLGRSRWLKRTILVGSSANVETVAAQLIQYHGEYGLIGRVARADAGNPPSGPVADIPDLGTLDGLEAILDRTTPDLVILVDQDVGDAGYLRVIESCYERDIHWKVVPRVPTPPNQDISLSVVGGIPLLGDRGNNITGFNFLLKRAVDMTAAAFLLLLFSPLMLSVAALIKLISPGPVLFKQQRVGYRGRPFAFYKFRSMQLQNDDSIHREYVKKYIGGDPSSELEDGGTVVHKITRDPRVIPFIGNFIRKFSIDELPQLMNVFKGDMSLVGPRPCLSYEVELYRRWHKMRFDVLPGITGLWQVSGRNRLSFDQMVALDIRYLQNWSLSMDLAIMLRTPYTVLFDKAF